MCFQRNIYLSINLEQIRLFGIPFITPLVNCVYKYFYSVKTAIEYKFEIILYILH